MPRGQCPCMYALHSGRSGSSPKRYSRRRKSLKLKSDVAFTGCVMSWSAGGVATWVSAIVQSRGWGVKVAVSVELRGSGVSGIFSIDACGTGRVCRNLGAVLRLCHGPPLRLSQFNIPAHPGVQRVRRHVTAKLPRLLPLASRRSSEHATPSELCLRAFFTHHRQLRLSPWRAPPGHQGFPFCNEQVRPRSGVGKAGCDLLQPSSAHQQGPDSCMYDPNRMRLHVYSLLDHNIAWETMFITLSAPATVPSGHYVPRT